MRIPVKLRKPLTESRFLIVSSVPGQESRIIRQSAMERPQLVAEQAADCTFIRIESGGALEIVYSAQSDVTP